MSLKMNLKMRLPEDPELSYQSMISAKLRLEEYLSANRRIK
jgi:hypothetical protein